MTLKLGTRRKLSGFGKPGPLGLRTSHGVVVREGRRPEERRQVARPHRPVTIVCHVFSCLALVSLASFQSLSVLLLLLKSNSIWNRLLIRLRFEF